MTTRAEGRLSRRSFLIGTGKTLAGIGAGALLAPRRARAASPNEKIVVAHIGVGSMGNAHVSWFAGFPDVEVAAICDVDETHRLETLQRLRQMRPETKAEPVADFRRVLDRPDIDAITCATPDHWHALISILAMQAGKDVYSEKPLSHTFAEAKAMAAACHRYGRVFQLGTQIHEGENYHRVVELVRSGVLGKIHTVRSWKTGGSPGLGYPQESDPPPTLDWDLWQGPAPWRPYTPARCHFTFRYFWDYSGGVYADFWCHITDVVFWALEPKGLHTISARGAVPDDGIADTPKWIDVDYEFDDLKIHWTTAIPDVPGAAGRGIGAQFEGTKGSLVCDYGSR
ncbi:MAG: Gfo/Idh/MocA family oxidoreductase, partial [Armatimonadetes bacterium]|nr:Gfo/Idh/MocA family oxidoreductase [Armatimonadota bacterium]